MIVNPEDMRPLYTSHSDALVIQLSIAIAMIRHILVDIGSSCNSPTFQTPSQELRTILLNFIILILLN